MKLKKILLFLSLMFIYGCNGDYSKNLGKGYVLEKTNTCCIFIYNKEANPIKIGKNIVYDNRTIKPLITKLYMNKEYIIGYKTDNKCCYLTECEKDRNTPNGYFIIYKNDGKIINGLNESEFIKYNIELKKMKQII